MVKQHVSLSDLSIIQTKQWQRVTQNEIIKEAGHPNPPPKKDKDILVVGRGIFLKNLTR